MNERITWLEYKEKKILYVDASNLSGQKFLDVVIDYKNTVINLENKSLLVILNVTNSHSNSEIHKTQVEVGKLGKGKAAAVVGVFGIQKVLARAIKKDFYFADSLEDAQEWLVKQ